MTFRSMTYPTATLLGLSALAWAPGLFAQGTSVLSPGASERPKEGAPPAPEAAPKLADPADTPAPAAVLLGPQQVYTPPLRFESKWVNVQGDFLLAFRAEGTSSILIDRSGATFQPGAVLAPMIRAGARLDSGDALKHVRIRAEYEHDVPTGYWTSDAPAAGLEMPYSAPIEDQIRKLYLRASVGPYLHIGGGFMTNQFGLGLLANDGASGNWTPGSARFADNRGGDRVIRGFIGTGPLTSAGATVTFAVDKVQADDVLLPGDEAIQLIGTASVGYGQPWGAGIFVVHRRQEAQTGEYTNATVVDLTARYAAIRRSISYSLEGELAFVVGDTSLGPTLEHPVHRIRQVGGALRLAARGRYAGGVFDLLFASGDGNPDDEVQTTFKADPNYETGLVLFRQVIAAQTGRAPITASDPNLVGEPSPGLERLPTRGSPTNAITLFPRAYVRPLDGLEMYGGPLLAWSHARLNDPLNTRFAGGVLSNALGGAAGPFLGAEIDLGARYRFLIRGTELTIGVEGAVFFPGDAFSLPGGGTMDPVLGGRALVLYRL